jgi:predicted DNA-binding transcriptional regulator AlpA
MIETAQRDDDEILHLPEVARKLRVREKTLRRHLDSIPHFRVGSRTFFRRSVIEAWISHQEAKARAGGE